MPKKRIKLALIQMNASEDKAQNLRRAEKLARQAARQKAQSVIFPECFLFRGKATLEFLRTNIAESLSGPTIKYFRNLARELKVALVLGSVYEKIPGKRKLYNTCVVINGKGQTIGHYRKKNLFVARLKEQRIRESDIFMAGKQGFCFSMTGCKTGATICYDLRFPELFRKYAQKGCQAVTVPSNFTYQTGKAHWEILLRARAIENQCFIVAPNQCGTDNRGVRAYGNSMIVDPWGSVISRAGTSKEEIIYGNIDLRDAIKAKKILS